jgi:hypothetical protein
MIQYDIMVGKKKIVKNYIETINKYKQGLS